MTEQRPTTITVAGDVCVDWLHWPAPAADEGLNWQLYPGTAWAALPGGAWQLADLVRAAAPSAAVHAPAHGDLAILSPDQALHSLAELAPFPAVAGRKELGNVYRLREACGYTGPRQGQPALAAMADDDPAADLLLLDDVGNGFRDAPAAWPAALRTEGANPLVIYKMYRPLFQGRLWQRLQSHDPQRLIVVIAAGALRDSGVNISQRLSWERTAKDFVWQMAYNAALAGLRACRHVLVRFDLEATIHYSFSGDQATCRLFYDPAQTEGGYLLRYPGLMQGATNAFIAGLAGALIRQNLPWRAGLSGETLDLALRAAIDPAMAAARRLHKLGYGKAVEPAAFPNPAIFDPAAERDPESVATMLIPAPSVPQPPDPTYWSVLRAVHGALFEDIATALVREGRVSALKNVPVGQFGKLRTADRAEIEGYRCICNLMREYLDSPATTRPLCIAVFGPPGSGKSFGVMQVVETISGRQPVKRLEFNLSQFRTAADLVQAFHRVRDEALAGVMPIAFFDEFDAAYEGELGWLKYFLAPMQDGQFRDGESMHPTGRAIFVFAGGTHDTFQSFSAAGTDEQRAAFKAVKGPDFVSRLRGYVNVFGPNPVHAADSAHIIRRAMVLRSLIERKAPQIVDSKGHARIDDGVLRALLLVPSYRHGARSMEAIIEMSMLAGQRIWAQASLPPAEQLAMHVDADVFQRLALRDVLFSAARELLAQAIHERYRQNQQGTKAAGDPAMQPWQTLSESLRESNRQQADEIGAKLKRIGCTMMPLGECAHEPFAYTDEEVEVLAEMEHERFVDERTAAGWMLGVTRDPTNKITPYLVPYAELPDEVKEWDRQAVRAIPEVLAAAQFGVCRVT